MSDPKPLASLSPTLLARKGAAKPAMRRQIHYPDSLARMVSEDDLGWNDMGDEEQAETGAAEPAPEPSHYDRDDGSSDIRGGVVPIKAKVELPIDPIKPMVLHHQEEIARQVIAPAPVHVPVQLPEPEEVQPVAPQVQAIAPPTRQIGAEPTRARQSALENGRRAAFTLRMDADRHLKLRLACTIRNRSAQQLLTEALDNLMSELPDLATLAAQVAERR